MYEFFALVGVAALWILIERIDKERSRTKPIRKLSPNPRRYYRKIEAILCDYNKDDTVKKFLVEVAVDLETDYELYKSHPTDEHLISIFGNDSFNKNREEALALCYLLSYHKSPIIINLSDKLKKRFLQLKDDHNVCPPALYAPFRDIRQILEDVEREKNAIVLKSNLIEELSKSNEFRCLFPEYTIEQMLSLFSKYKYDIHIFKPEDVSKESVRIALYIIRKHLYVESDREDEEAFVENEEDDDYFDFLFEDEDEDED